VPLDRAAPPASGVLNSSDMAPSELPGAAAWRHHAARDGFESVFFCADASGYRLEGATAAVEDGDAWVVRYEIELDDRWVTRAARVWSRSASGVHERELRADRPGCWRLDGRPAPELDGLVDVDLESSACTNTIPVHRLALAPGQSADAPAVYVRALDLRVERLDQSYRRADAGDADRRVYDYRADRFGYAAPLVYDRAGLVVDYPGIATRVL
jgi:uncharacterized protein